MPVAVAVVRRFVFVSLTPPRVSHRMGLAVVSSYFPDLRSMAICILYRIAHPAIYRRVASLSVPLLGRS